MAATPNLDELKSLTESGKLIDGFKLLIMNDKAEEEAFIARMGEESTQLREVIQKKGQTVDEVDLAFPHFNLVAASGRQAMLEIELTERRKVDLLAQLLVLCRESLRQKDELLEMLDDVDSSDEE